MNKITYAAVLLCMSFSPLVWAAPPAANAPAMSEVGYDAKAACERYAQEDQIKPEHMADYMNQCLRDLGNDHSSEQDLDPAPIEQLLDAPTPVVPPPASIAPPAKGASPAKQKPR
ncbi:MAG: hypothetical protein H7839_15305 [Magnetococcus sp. YQC-5]